MNSEFFFNLAMMLCAIMVIGGAVGFVIGMTLLFMGHIIAGGALAVFGLLASAFFQTVADDL